MRQLNHNYFYRQFMLLLNAVERIEQKSICVLSKCRVWIFIWQLKLILLPHDHLARKNQNDEIQLFDPESRLNPRYQNKGDEHRSIVPQRM